MKSAEQPSVFASVVYTPPDVIFELTKKYLTDPAEQKVNLGQGTYRDENGSPWILPCVRAAKEKIRDVNHEYLPILGLTSFRTLAAELVLGRESTALIEKRVASCQALSGTGAIHMAGKILYNALGSQTPVYITNPTWSNHRQVFASIGFLVREYTYYSETAGCLNMETVTQALNEAPPGSIFIFHVSAHNPTGCDPTQEQWKDIATIVQDRGLFPIFDAAYLGMTSGVYDRDAYAIRYFVEELRLEVAVCASFAKNMGLYGERVGLASIITRSPQEATAVESAFEQLMRAEVSNPPAFGARVAAAVLEDGELRAEWARNLTKMSSRVEEMRWALFDGLKKLETPGSWDRIVKQGGMFCLLGLTPEQVVEISIAGLNWGNVQYVAECIDQTIRPHTL
ncbi:hypothetical protein OIDMADRAFT_137587 [Oidiodendron maius Zn]|uniref:Aspartate aminotransferase n=1 Tax=Oidiodendron maius (strain Zn) TaxID=913774 RepID=A0A0C3GBI3_OIDMZ|nr:hypothetical protein OIDMADRAFT_137587 [Oidiodendron maius Zn]